MRVTRREYFGIQRKIVANVTSDSWQNVPHVCYMYEPDVTELYKEYTKLNKGREGENKITFNTLMLKIIAEGLKAAPIMNSHIDFNRRFVTGKIDTFEEINISMPTILPNGEMMTINLRDFGNRKLDDMTAYINDVRRRAEKTNLTEAMYNVAFNKTIETLRQGKLFQVITRIGGANFGKCKVDHLRGKAKKEYDAIPETERLTMKDLEQGTVTVSNVGSIYRGQHGAVALLEIVPPQVSAFAIGAIQDRPVVIKNDDGSKDIGIRSILPLCITFDHRAIDFGDIVPFMKKVDEILDNPSIIHTWVSNDKNDNTKDKKNDDFLTVVA